MAHAPSLDKGRSPRSAAPRARHLSPLPEASLSIAYSIYFISDSLQLAFTMMKKLPPLVTICTLSTCGTYFEGRKLMGITFFIPGLSTPLDSKTAPDASLKGSGYGISNSFVGGNLNFTWPRPSKLSVPRLLGDQGHILKDQILHALHSGRPLMPHHLPRS